jgi:hypothetical protein
LTYRAWYFLPTTECPIKWRVQLITFLNTIQNMKSGVHRASNHKYYAQIYFMCFYDYDILLITPSLFSFQV